MNKIFIKDKKGNKLTIAQTMALIPGSTYQKVRHQVVNNKVKTLEGIREAVSRLKNGRVMYETTRGRLTIGEMVGVHDDENMTATAMTNRIGRNGSMDERIWGPLNSNGMNNKVSEKIQCTICDRWLDIRQFRILGVKTSVDECKKCRGETGHTGRNKSSIKVYKRCLTVKPGDLVESCGKLYKASECFPRDNERRATVAGFRVMPGGQILKNTTVNLDANWIKVG